MAGKGRAGKKIYRRAGKGMKDTPWRGRQGLKWEWREREGSCVPPTAKIYKDFNNNFSGEWGTIWRNGEVCWEQREEEEEEGEHDTWNHGKAGNRISIFLYLSCRLQWLNWFILQSFPHHGKHAKCVASRKLKNIHVSSSRGEVTVDAVFKAVYIASKEDHSARESSHEYRYCANCKK